MAKTKRTAREIIADMTTKLVTYHASNKAKNAQASAEKKATKELGILAAEYTEATGKPTVRIPLADAGTAFVVGNLPADSQQIDVRKLHELYPDKFWDMISATQAAVRDHVGDRAVSECLVVTTADKFQIVKESL